MISTQQPLWKGEDNMKRWSDRRMMPIVHYPCFVCSVKIYVPVSTRLILTLCWSWKSRSLLALYTACFVYEDGGKRGEETSESIGGVTAQRLGCSSVNQHLCFLSTFFLSVFAAVFEVASFHLLQSIDSTSALRCNIPCTIKTYLYHEMPRKQKP